MCETILHEIILEAACTVDYIITYLPWRMQKKWYLEVETGLKELIVSDDTAPHAWSG